MIRADILIAILKPPSNNMKQQGEEVVSMPPCYQTTPGRTKVLLGMPLLVGGARWRVLVGDPPQCSCNLRT